MLYYSNASLTKPHMTFVGRWSPFHNGHATIIKKKIAENPNLPVLIQVRATKYDTYKPEIRAEILKIWLIENNLKGSVMIIPDIEGIYWGRGVGYNLSEVVVNQEIKSISATKIRKSIKANENTWQGLVASKNIANLLNKNVASVINSGLVIWLTGCPCSGKSTISNNLTKKVSQYFPFLKIQQLDGDVMRESPISIRAGFSAKDRSFHLQRMAHLAMMFANHGILVVCSFVSPYEKYREKIKEVIGRQRYIEIYVKAKKKTRINRDGKGMYAKAMKGEIKNFTGYNSPYEVPSHPNIICNTDSESVNQSVNKIITYSFGRHD